MYDYVDRPIAALGSGSALLVRAMRGWVAAMAARSCPPGAIGPAFDAAGVLPALPHFHMAMMLLNKEALEAVQFAPSTCTHIAEDEAILLRLLATIGQTPSERSRTTLGMIVVPGAIAPLAAALTGLAHHLSDAGLGLGIAARPGRPLGQIHE